MATSIPREALRTLIASLTGIPATRVYWTGEAERTFGPVAGGKAGRVTLGLLGREENGTLEPRREYTSSPEPRQTVEWGAHRTLSISIRVDALIGLGEAYDLLENVRIKLAQPAPRAALRAVDLAFLDAPSITQLDYVIDGRPVSSASLDVRFAQVVSTVAEDDPEGWIEKVSSTTPDDIEAAPVYGLDKGTFTA